MYMIQTILCTLLLATLPPSRASAADAPAPDPGTAPELVPVLARAESLVRRLLDPAKLAEANIRFQKPQRVQQRPAQPWQQDLSDIWDVRFEIAGSGAGHLFLRANGEMAPEEFAFDFSAPVLPLNGALVSGVPNLQQFPISSALGSGKTASGCVPTAGGNLLVFWARRMFPLWIKVDNTPTVGAAPPEGTSPETAAAEAATLRLRKNMHMMEIDDAFGYADGKMTLSGAFPNELAKALEKDALTHRVPVQIKLHPVFSLETLRSELESGRPALAFCVARLPQKPDLSWGHAVVATGWQQVEDFDFVGVVDNFFPVRNSATVRWIEKGAFNSIIVVRPGDRGRNGATQKPSP